ncbi:hypothetical protein FJZ19_03385 [Candidatus Pacearchaeota archaeon]|nr:hypothetical protein [Candidatus Pacearchaeota archaeon]
MSTICIFGDSITYGACDYEFGGWANRIVLFLNKLDDFDLTAYNLGIPGDTTNSLLTRFNIEAKARNPNIIIFAVGINDSQDSTITLTKFKENLVNLIKKAREFTNEILFVGLTPVDESISGIKEDNYFNEKIKKYDLEIKKVCNEEKLKYIDISGLISSKELEDGLHPNSKGHEKIFVRAREFLIKNKVIK